MSDSDQSLMPLTPRQVRAGRALLAWSQQDLAREAGVASSTVADFERGKRTPIPQNGEAMKDALEQAGVSFPDGGAVIGPPVPVLAPTSKSGAPIRWVTATDISQWAERRDGQGSIPALLAKLARAAGVGSLHFAADEGVQYAGWDGSVTAAVDTEYIPAGASGWEIGTQRDNIAGKADEDYAKRTKHPLGVDPATSTFIFVTPRHWPKKDEWAKRKRDEGTWRDIRAYDGADLVHWIELYPAVGQWLANSLGKRPAGARQLEEVWLEWSLATQWQLTPDLILSDRDEDAAAVLRWLRGQPVAFGLQAGTPEEVAAFVYATISQLPTESAEHYFARCLVAATPEVARQLAQSVTPLIIVVLEPDPGLVQAIAQRGHHVLAAYGDNPGSRGIRKLERPSREGIEAALLAGGLPEAKARNFAREAARSLAILRRLMPGMPGRLPEWAQGTPSRALLAALLAGAWDEGSTTDKAVLSRLADMPYEVLVADLAPLVGRFDSPLRKVGEIWKVASPQDAWLLLASHFSLADIERFQEIVVDVLGAADPRYEMKSEERWYASIKGIKPEYSESLRHGLGEILIMLALFGARAQAVPAADKRAEMIVRKLLHGADRQRWWSLSRDFQLLSEAAPDAFLEAVDHSLDQNDPPIAALFGSDDSPMFGTEHLSHLLWALESLAWAPQYLGRVSSALARLDELDPGGRYVNRPGNSLRQIFLLWSPQTNAPLGDRIRVLDQLRKRLPNPTWKLMLGILPGGHDSFSPSPPTRWRDLSADNKEDITYALIGRGAQEIVARLRSDVKADAPRWVTLIDRWSDLGPDRAAAARQLQDTVGKFPADEDRGLVWDRLRRLLNHHRSFSDADWVLPDEDLRELEGIYNALAPTDPITRVSWLFDNGPTLPNPEGGWEKHDAQVRAERLRVAKLVLVEHGTDALFKLAESVGDAGPLGAALVDAGVDDAACEALLYRALRSGVAKHHYLAHGIIVAIFPRKGEIWAANLFRRAADEEWGEASVLVILRALPYTRWTWDRARDAGHGIEEAYWKRAPILWLKGDDTEVSFAVDKLIEVGRARHGVQMAGLQLHQGRTLKSEQLVKLLLEAVSQPIDGEVHDNDKAMFQYHVIEILKQLDNATDVTTETMLRLEWAYLPLLERSERPATVIMNELAKNPELFVQIICAVYMPSEDSGVVEKPPEDMERARNIATQAYRLLRLWNVVPGTLDGGQIDGVKLEAWVKEARKLAKAAGREIIAEQKIGEVLASSPADADGVWPAQAVRELIETIRSSHAETGLLIGRRNRRGVTTRMPRDGGAQERSLVQTYRDWAKATAYEWPRISAVLEKLAKGYEEDARFHDEDAERLDWL